LWKKVTLRFPESPPGFCAVVDEVLSVAGFFKIGFKGGSGVKVSSRTPNQKRLWVS
jgi:hypothetical protein